MKISVDDQELFSLSETQKSVIKNDISSDDFDSDMKRRLKWILTHKYEQCFERMKKEWEPKLKERYSTIPTNDDAFVSLICSQSDYKDALVRKTECELEAKQLKQEG
jgi:hypothetical protein